MTTTNDIRATFLDFFARNDHAVLPSSPLVPHNDPTLMFTNAGMVQFKNIFTGVETPKAPRAVTSQKCVRAGGKHNDLENVGYTARHHTFFEMLGNFSFGDYFKEKAITLAWELLTKEFGLPAEKLFVTVYHTDDEAFDLWRKISGLPEAKILRVPTSDNFWAMGDTGPCGPCSEIFYDHGEGRPGQWALDANGNDLFDARFVEIWNLVFMQYEQRTADDRISLPKPSIDTGMGLERMAAVIQGKHDNYDIDLFQNLMTVIARESEGLGAVKDKVGITAHRVIADHLRSSCFLIADGVLPSNEGRGYVLRRIMRRAMRYAHQLGCQEPLMHRLVPSLIKEMGQAFPELRRAEALATETLQLEESRFKQTLGRGLKLLEEATSGLQSGANLAGDVAFKLYDTYGFPLDLTQDILRGHGQGVDVDGFNAAMAEQKARARAAWAGSGEAATGALWFDLKEKAGVSEFVGYQQERTQGRVTALVKDGAAVDAVKTGDTIAFTTNQTVFYGESGGQIGDRGMFTTESGAVVEINDTKKPLEHFHVHHGVVKSGSLAVGDSGTLAIDAEYRAAIRANHSATHLLHAALRKTLGEHVTQKGSLVSADRLRFDISHPKAITREELRDVELQVNAIIRQNRDTSTRLMTPDAAIEAGALALFGEKYGEEVRVVSMGAEGEETHYSVELCGGTHVARTGDIGLFVVTGESAIAAGVRRIEATTGKSAIAFLYAQQDIVQELAGQLKVAPGQIPEKVAQQQETIKQLEKQLAEARKSAALGGGGMEVEQVSGTPFLAKFCAGLPAKELRQLGEQLRQKHKEAIIALASDADGKASIIVAAPETVDVTALVRIGAEVAGGQGGGGRGGLAQAGGPDGSKAEAALEAIRQAVANQALQAAS